MIRRRVQNVVGWGLVAVLVCGPALAQVPRTVVINEVLAGNTSVNKDPQGEYDDWIELYNNADVAVNVGGMYLTDDPAVPTKWQIPKGSPYLTMIGAGHCLLVWADAETADSALHAGFKLDADGETIGLFDKDGVTCLDSVTFPGQRTDVSYGRDPADPSQWRYLVEPTPGKVNAEAFAGVASDVVLSHTRGFYDQPFSLEMTTETPGVLIAYTLDGSVPCDAGGSLSPAARIYTGPIPIRTTTCVRAVAYQPGWLAAPVQTHTYLFLKDVVRQPRNPSGFPASYGSWADYEMDPDITNSPVYGPLMEEALLSLPILSIVMNTNDLFGSNGFYANPSRRGADWERPTSVELIRPDSAPGFQIDCGVQIQGGAFRTMSGKHSLRLVFKGLYGATRLRYPLFEEDAVDEFDTVTLRAGANDGYSWNGARYTEQYIRDEFGRDLQRATGNAGSHGTFVHLYLNGLYWGLYNLCERPDASFSAGYFGGQKEDWDALHNGGSTEAVEGDLRAWNEMLNLCRAGLTSNEAYQKLQGNNSDGTRNPAYPHLLDVPEYIDYLIVNVWGGNWDWPWKNWYAARDRTAAGTGFKFFCWDFENTMGNNLNRSPLNHNSLNNNFSSAGEPHQYLRQNAEYRLLFADHVHRFLFNGGVLTPESLIPRYTDLAAGVELAMVCESARWGDQFHHPPLTLEDWYDRDQNYNDGRAGRGWILNHYLPQRTGIVLQQFKSAGLYPAVGAPVFHVNGTYRHGGHMAATDSLSMMIPQGTTGAIYYTLDGEDPRQPASGSQGSATSLTLVPENAPKKVLVPTRDIGATWQGGNEPFDESTWNDGTPVTTVQIGGVGYDQESTYLPYITYDVKATMYGKNTSCYIRIPFTVKAEDLATLKALTLRARCDDGYVAFLNGVEVASLNRPATLAWNSTCANPGDLTTFVEAVLPDASTVLRAGANVLAVQAINTTISSSDFLFSVELIGSNAVASESDAELSPSAIAYTGPVRLGSSAMVKARVFSSGTWSALNEAIYAVGPVAESLRISEIMYHPKETGDPGDPNTEFIELTNVGSQAVNLNLVRFAEGIHFTFGDAVVPPGQYLLVVKDAAAFTARYGPGVPVAGTYTGSLDNGGERIRLEDAVGQTILDFEYQDGWYKSTDGDGYSLVLRQPRTADPAALGDKALWRASLVPGGSPGDDDSGQ